MISTDKIDIDFQVLNTNNPKKLVVCDTSVWGSIEDRPAIIEITPPMSETKVVYNLNKKQNTIFNTSNLLLSPIGQYNDLPDGIYKITIKGSPDTFKLTRYYLKTDTLQLKIDEMHIEYGFFNDEAKEELFDYYISLKAAESLTRMGRYEEALKYYNRVRDNVEATLDCKDCH